MSSAKNATEKANIMKENEIRPDCLKKSQLACIEQDIQFLVERKNCFVEVDCPACQTYVEQILFEKSGFSYRECPTCRMLFMSPRPTEDILGEFYAGSDNYRYFNDHIFPASKEARREKIFKPRAQLVGEICEQYRLMHGSLLEIGAGYGIFCEEILKSGYFDEVSAVEATDALSETVGRLGVRLYSGIFENIEFDRQFDVVVEFEVIEHIFNPQKHLEKIFPLLRTGGLLLLTFPNYDGFEISTLGRFSDSIDHEHLNYFNERAIIGLLEKTGYSPLFIRTPGKLDVEMVGKKILNGEYSPPGIVRDICVDSLETIGSAFQLFLQEHNLSSHMLVAAIKRIP